MNRIYRGSFLKKAAHFITIIIIINIILTPLRVMAETEGNANCGYDITSYNTDVILNKDNSYTIKSVINTNYYAHSNSGFRYRIPVIDNELLKKTGEERYINLSSISASDSFESYVDNGYYCLQIGDKSKLITGPKTYEISYTVSLGKESASSENDSITIELINGLLDAPVHNFSFSIHTPGDADDVNIEYILRGIDNTDRGVNYTYMNDTIEGTYDYTILPNENFVFSMTLPEGYFEYKTPLLSYLILFLPLFVLIISFVLFITYFKTKKNKGIRYTFPKGLTSADVSYIWLSEANKESLLSVLITLANEGYIRITNTSNTKKSVNFVFEKITDYTGKSKVKIALMDGLFNKKEEISSQELVKNKHFNCVINKLIKSAELKIDKLKRPYNKIQLLVFSILNLFCFLSISVFPICIFNKYTINDNILLYAISLLTFIAVSLILSLRPKKIIYTAMITIFIVISFAGYAYFIWKKTVYVLAIINQPHLLIMTTLGMIGFIILLLLAQMQKQYNDVGEKYLAEITQTIISINNLKKDNKENIINVLEDTPDFYEKTLPYTLALFEENGYASIFKNIELEKPDWYESPTDYNALNFGKEMRKMIRSLILSG